MSESLVAIQPAVQQFLDRQHGLWIEGRQAASDSEKRLNVYNPATGEVIASTADASVDDVDRAVMSGWRAFVARTWAGKLPAERERILLRFADLVEQAEAEQGILAEPGGPRCGQGGVRADGVQYVPAALHFHMMPLSVVETDRKDAIETVEGPSEAGRGVLSAGKNDKGRRVCIAGHMLS